MNDTTTLPADPDLSGLAHDGDTVDLGNGLSLLLRIEGDDSGMGWNDMMDAECFGTVEWTRATHGHAPRPDGFDGAARKILTDGWDVCWWQPPTAKAIGTVWTDEQWREQTAYVRERVEYGWSQVGLELRETVTDSLGGEHAVVLDRTWLGGVDDTSSDYLPSVVSDLYAELGHLVSQRMDAA